MFRVANIKFICAKYQYKTTHLWTNSLNGPIGTKSGSLVRGIFARYTFWTMWGWSIWTLVQDWALSDGGTRTIFRNSQMLNSSWNLSAIILAMAKEEVAPGEGAFLQWRILEPTSHCISLWNTKSSSREPSTFMACARTPAGPFTKSDEVISGMKRFKAFT